MEGNNLYKVLKWATRPLNQNGFRQTCYQAMTGLPSWMNYNHGKLTFLLKNYTAYAKSWKSWTSNSLTCNSFSSMIDHPNLCWHNYGLCQPCQPVGSCLFYIFFALFFFFVHLFYLFFTVKKTHWKLNKKSRPPPKKKKKKKRHRKCWIKLISEVNWMLAPGSVNKGIHMLMSAEKYSRQDSLASKTFLIKLLLYPLYGIFCCKNSIQTMSMEI